LYEEEIYLVKLLTIQRAKDEINRLQEYINLVDTFETNTLENWIIREYAITGSIKTVVANANNQSFTYNSGLVDRTFVTAVINGKANDRLHKLVRSIYRQKVKSRKK
jgi:hypothetical protein